MTDTLSSHSGSSPPARSVVTYRHLQARTSSSSARHPLRCIAHCDIDSAYAQFQSVRLGLDNSVPLACNQWDHLIAVNYAARAIGVSKFMRAGEALSKFPDLKVPHVATYRLGDAEPAFWENPHPSTHKVSLEPFRRESQKIMAIFAEFCQAVERASIDEAYLDFTQAVTGVILQRHPELATVPPGCSLDSPLPPPPRFVLRHSDLIPIKPDEVAHQGDREYTWSDYSLSIASEIMQRCRQEIRDRLGYTCSAGIAENKLLAKVCSACRKPNAQTVLIRSDVPRLLSSLPFKKLRSFGRKLGEEIALVYQAETVSDLWPITLQDFQKQFGSQGSWIYDAIRGIEHGEVIARLEVKSLLTRKDFKPALTNWEQVQEAIRLNAIDLYYRLTEAQRASPGLWPATLFFGIRRDDYRSPSRHRQAPFPRTRNLTLQYIVDQSEKLGRAFFSQDERGYGNITNVSLGFSGLERVEGGQGAITSFLQASSKQKRVRVEGSSSTPRRAAPLQSSNSASPIDLTISDSETSDSGTDRGRLVIDLTKD